MGTRISVYLSDDLKKRMDKCREPVNWSQVASNAFELKLGEVAEVKEKKTMTDVVQRLRAAKIKNSGGKVKAAMPFGREWATEDAEPDQLERLAEYAESECAFDHTGVSSAHSIAEHIAFAILDIEKDRQGAREFWQTALGIGDFPDDKTAEGFARGALEVWEAVRDQV